MRKWARKGKKQESMLIDAKGCKEYKITPKYVTVCKKVCESIQKHTKVCKSTQMFIKVC